MKTRRGVILSRDIVLGGGYYIQNSINLPMQSLAYCNITTQAYATILNLFGLNTPYDKSGERQ